MSFDQSIVDAVWNKGIEVEGISKDVARKDPCNAWIMKERYLKEGEFGWDIDYICPKSMGGDDSLINLRPMHWKNKIAKGDDYPVYQSAVVASGLGNIGLSEVTCCRINKALQDKFNKLYGIK